MPSEKEVAALLRSRRAEERIRGVQKAQSLPPPEQQALLLRALDDRSNYIAALAAQRLVEIAADALLPALIERFFFLMEDGLERDPGCHVRAALAFGFGRREVGKAADALRAGIRASQIEYVAGERMDTAAQLRANCALALAQIRAPDAIRDITPLLFDTGVNLYEPGRKRPPVSVETRKAAARALGQTADPNALIPLGFRLQYTGGAEPEVLQECMQAVVTLEDPRAVELLAPYLQDSDELLVAYAALMIAQTQAPNASLWIQEAIPRLRADALQAAVLALTVIRAEEGRHALRELAGHEREAVRLAVAAALRHARDEPSRACLLALAETDRSAAVRKAARASIED